MNTSGMNVKFAERFGETNIKMFFEEARSKLMKYCAYQERCHKEVEDKLRSIGTDPETSGQVILYLLENNFLNEERFARAFAGGKFRTKKWGRMRIMRELGIRDISEYCIQKAMEEIDESNYRSALEHILETKSKSIKGKNIYEFRNQLAKFAIQKGYEPQMVWDLIREKYEEQ